MFYDKIEKQEIIYMYIAIEKLNRNVIGNL